MHAQCLIFNIGPGMRDEAVKMADKFALLHKQLNGFKSGMYFGDPSSGDYGSITIWETPEDIKSAAAVLRPKLEEALSGKAKSAPSFRIFEFYESKA